MSGSGTNGDSGLQRSISDLFPEDEDDDMSFEPASEQSIDGQEDDTETDEFADARELLRNGDLEIVFGDDEDDDEDGGEDQEQDGDTETEAQPEAAATATGTAEGRRLMLDLRALIQGRDGLQRILAGGNYRIVTYGDDNEDEDEDDGEYYPHRYHRRRRAKRNLDPNRFPKIPNETGRKLMQSGYFGGVDTCTERICQRKRSVSERLLWRRLGIEPRSTARRHNQLIAQELIPNTTYADKIIHYDSRAYSGQFSDDGNFFFSCTQNFKVQMYDTSNPYNWKYYKTVDFPFGQWTITDATLSPDNRFLAYSSIRHTVCLAPTDPNDRNEHTLLDFTNYGPGAIMGDQRHAAYMGRQGFGIWSLRFSGDGREIVAGTSDHSVLVHDLETRRTILKLRKHGDDVNAVCFGDKSSPHILFSGSDDQTIRVWDRRSMADGREAGVFVGHTEGLTYVDSKGDGRYVLSNGKDQMMKMWDLRKMTQPNDFDQLNLARYTTSFDYRFAEFSHSDWEPNPADNSIVTFRGHSVLKTLIRCHFSPPTSTNSRYVYSGSEDGKVYIWDLDGTQRATIDVGTATKDTRPKMNGGHDNFDWDMGYASHVWKTCVRDASWSPTAPVIAATSWNGWGMSTGTVSVHSWNDSQFTRTSPPSKRTASPPKHGPLGEVPGYWDDHEDDGDPEMGQSFNARLEPRHGFRSSKDAANQTRGWGRAAGRGLRSNPVRAQRYGNADEENGW
ncbi:hypothetical protein LTS08_006687 [Lithohypha guttulata]|uniref:uncharacterized protein n=1 Tax=Lithohypha guttulata TaxID=1690604 RepID=UPI002DE1A541|nr:hypothetical protein LTR51_008064 [Lithohypha guttulata]KAK5097932.1 hypothetical protein LTS08_006687 [Lithohypha guttulata]